MRAVPVGAIVGAVWAGCPPFGSGSRVVVGRSAISARAAWQAVSVGRRLAAVTAAVAAVVVALGLAGCSGAAPEPAGPQGIVATITTPPASVTAAPRPAPTSRTSTAPATGWYVALGDSLAAGMQPTTGDDK